MSYTVKVENLSKKYLINHLGGGAKSLREGLTSSLTRVKRWFGGNGVALIPEKTGKTVEEFWALYDVSFEISEGERVAIIGGNGAGKSTLLKILSRITEPTAGRIAIRGSVSSLLEVGTGFHPELTGRENIFLNGAILGMSRAEIQRKFDQIVDFSGVEKFLDTPVKHYSSGMYVRLAFSVSAWLDPDILIVDEVLAVGDQVFQRKCIERMREISGEGRTVLFVSHSMAAVNSMCQKALLLDRGRMMQFGPVDDVIKSYIKRCSEQEDGQEGWHRPRFTGGAALRSEYVECLGGSVESVDGEVLARPPIHEPFAICLHYRVLQPCPHKLVPNIHLYDEEGRRVFVAMPEHSAPPISGEYIARCIIDPFTINTGLYSVGLALSSYELVRPVHFDAQYALRFEVIEPEGVDRRRHGFSGGLPGVTRPRLKWQIAHGRTRN